MPVFRRSINEYNGGSLSRLLCRALATAAVLIWTQSAALAQGGSQIVYQQRTPWLEATVVMALCGAALFAVCRSSRRN
jgi:hypothetical protein